jgi:uncharacterized protein
VAPVSSPFVYEDPVAPADLIDRDEQAKELLDRTLDGRNTRLVAPRRYGKTSLLGRLREEAAMHDMQPVYVDFFGVVSIADVTERVERAYREQLQGALRNWFEGVMRTLKPRAQIGVPGTGVSVTPQPSQASLLDRLSLPRRLHDKHGTRVLVVFDEFQDLLRAGNQIDAVFRSEIEHHASAVAYIFCGSHPGTELFGDRRRAFYGQASPVSLGPLAPDDVSEYIAERFERTGRDPGEVLGPLLDTAGGHPQRTMLLAHHLWLETEPGSPADTDSWQRALDAALRELEGEFEAAWRGYSTTKQRLLVSIADNSESILSARNRARYGLPKTGSYLKPLRELEGVGEIEEAESPTGYRLIDPLFALWIGSGRSWPWSSEPT